MKISVPTTSKKQNRTAQAFHQTTDARADHEYKVLRRPLAAQQMTSPKRNAEPQSPGILTLNYYGRRTGVYYVRRIGGTGGDMTYRLQYLPPPAESTTRLELPPGRYEIWPGINDFGDVQDEGHASAYAIWNQFYTNSLEDRHGFLCKPIVFRIESGQTKTFTAKLATIFLVMDKPLGLGADWIVYAERLEQDAEGNTLRKWRQIYNINHGNQFDGTGTEAIDVRSVDSKSSSDGETGVYKARLVIHRSGRSDLIYNYDPVSLKVGNSVKFRAPLSLPNEQPPREDIGDPDLDYIFESSYGSRQGP